MNSELLDNLLPLAPELGLLAGALVFLLFGVYFLHRLTPLMIGGALVALALPLFLVWQATAEPVTAFNGMFVSNAFTVFSKLLILLGAALSLMVSARWLTEEGGQPFEFVVLMLMAVLGMMCMVSANDLLALYLGLELSSLSLYVLAAFQRDHARSSEAGLKYFVLGALASGLLLFGISLVYGFTGTIGFEQLAAHLSQFADEAGGGAGAPKAVLVGLVLILVAFCFKVSAVPFHMWTPDVYEGAPTPVTTFFATAPKVAAFALLARVLLEPFADTFSSWQQVVAAVSMASMLVGALAALRQTNLKRLLAYSSIGHAGFMLMGLAAGSSNGVAGLLIYLTTYVFMSAGAFGCVLMMRRRGHYVETVADLAGLAHTRPRMAAALAVFMFSMAGIPPLAGFFGKMYVVLPAIEAGLIPLAVLGLVTSVISCYYYLRVVKFMYFDEPADTPFDVQSSLLARVAVCVCALFTLLFFVAPLPVVSAAREAASLLLR